MERRRRRLFTVAISVAAGLVVLAAAASGLFRLAVESVPGYRLDVERYVHDLTGRAVRIGSLSLTWRYYYPSLDLNGVALLGLDEKTVALQAERLRLGFSLGRLVRGDYRPSRLELVGLALDARIDHDGHVSVKGIEQGPEASEPVDALQPLTQFAQLKLARCRVNLRDARESPAVLYSFGLESAELSRGLLGSDLSADVALPAQVGEAAHLDVSFTGPTFDPRQWSGAGSLELSGVAPGFWLQRFLVAGASVQSSGVEVTVQARFDAGKLLWAGLDVDSAALRVARGDRTAGFNSLEASADVNVVKDGWIAHLKKFALDGGQGRWPAAQGELTATLPEGAAPRYEGKLAYVRLGDLAPWLAVLQAPAAAVALEGLSGEVHDFSMQSEGEGEGFRYQYRARFSDLGLAARERPLGFSGASGEVAGDERGGRVVLSQGPFTLLAPGKLSSPSVPFDALEGELSWQRQGDALRIDVPQLRASALGLKLEGKLDLKLPEGASPEMNLSATFATPDATRAKALMPLHWSQGLRSWLDRAIVSGSAERAQLEIHGPLADFPFADKPTGVFSLDIDAANLDLAYQPDWPAIVDFAATLHFRGNSLAIETSGGTIGGNPIDKATARFPDFHTGQLLIDGAVHGETAKFYDFLRASPLKDTFHGLLEQTSALGPSSVEIHIDMPVSHAQDTQVSGRVSIDGVQLDYKGLSEPIRNVRGVIDFVPGKVSSDKLTAQLWELPIDAKLSPLPDNVTLLTATFPFTVNADGKGASQLVPEWVRRRVSGTSTWLAHLPLGNKAGGGLVLSTDLSGIAVKLPAPLGKPASEMIPLTITVDSSDEAPLRITSEYKERFGTDLRFAREGGRLAMERGTLRVGPGELIAPKEKGLVLLGRVEEGDVRAWLAEIQAPGGGDGQPIKRADLSLGRVYWDHWTLRETQAQWVGAGNGWSIDLKGPGATGALRWMSNPANAGGNALQVRLESIALDALPATSPETEPQGALDPNAWPVLDVDGRHVTVGGSDMGHVTLVTERSAAGQKAKTLHAEGGIVRLDGKGEWRRRAGQSSGNLDAELSSTDIGALLKAFGYAANLDAKGAHIKASLAWAPSADGLSWAYGQGPVHLEFENGQLRSVDPGAGRVLGLVNFYALPRRLTLNFRDVVSSGLGFDRITGDFELAGGNATTQNLTINGPSLRMDVHGRIGLAARDYDQQVNVYPDVSAGATLGALVLGGPVAGVLTLIAQQILNKPLDQVTQLSYRVTGSWDNPQVERSSAIADELKRVTGPPSQKK